jgi:hypothetical protein
VLLPINIATGPIESTVQIGAFPAGELTVGFKHPFLVADGALFHLQAAKLATSQFTGAHTLPNSVLLIVLSVINAETPSACLGIDGKTDQGCDQ